MDRSDALTPRQRDVLGLLAKGLTNGEIARALEISISTVKCHVEHILRALGATNRTEAAMLATQLAGEAGISGCATLAARPAIAVLRFDVEPGDPLAPTFAAGLADEVITLLCKWRWFPVIARSTSFFCDTTQSMGELRRWTGAAYLLSGRAAHAGGRLRVHVHLDDTRNEQCLWSERFDIAAGDVFALQDEIAAAVVAHAYAQILEAEGRVARASPSKELTAWQLTHQALLLVDTGRRADNQRALALFERASLAEPRFVLPLYGRGMAFAERIFNQWSEQIADDLAELERCADRAIDIDATDVAGWALAGRGAIMAGEPRRAIEPLERAVALCPCHERAQAWLGLAHVAEGARAGFANLKLATRLSPRANSASLGLAHFAMEDYEQAAAACREALRYKSYAMIHAVLCASLALSGDAASARAEVARVRECEPGYSLAGWHQMVPPGRHDVTDRITAGLRAAGLDS